nr:hypothetical protein [Tanacetum cinerariifolium]
MADLHFNNDHNKGAYLLKLKESQGFHPIIDFMNGLYIKYALTANPTINAYLGPDMPLLAHMLNQGEPALVQAQPQEVSPPPPSLVVEPHPSTDPMPSPPRQSSPSPIPFVPAPSSGVASTYHIPEIPSSSRPTEPMLETITSPIRDDDTGGGSFLKRPPSPSHATPTCSPTVAKLKATKILHRDAVVLFAKQIKKLESNLKTKKRKLALSDSENKEYALTANPTINASLVRQFWGSASEVSLPDDVKGLNQFASNIAIALICLSTGRKYNFSNMIFNVLETITSPIRDDDTDGGSFHESPPSPPPVTPTRSPTRITTLEAELKATKMLHKDKVVLFAKRIKKLESKLKTKKRKLSSSGLDFTDTAISAVGRVSAGGADPTDVVVSAGGADSAGTFISGGVLFAAGPSVPSIPSSPIRDLAKGKAVATPSSPITAPTDKELADQQAAILEAERQELLEQELKQSLDAEQVYLDSLLAQRVAKEQERKSRASAAQAVDLAIAKDHHQHLKRSGDTLESSKSKKLKSSHSTKQSAELQETTSVFAGATIAADDPISAVPFVSVVPSVFAASSIPAETPITAGVSNTAGVSESDGVASVPIIQLLDSPPKATSLPLDPETAEQEIIPTEFGLGEIHVITRADDTVMRFSTLRELMHSVGQADLMVLYGMVSNKYKFERATCIGLGLWSDLRTLITAREDRDASIIWDDQDQWEIQSCRFYALPAIHVLETEAGDIMYMFVDKKYLILPVTIQRMLNHGLEIDRDPSGNDLTTAI